MRRRTHLLGGLLLVLSFLASTAPGAFAQEDVAVEVGLTHDDPSPSPHGLAVRGTNGDEVVVQAVAPMDGNGPRVWVTANGKDGSVKYSAPADLSNEGIRSNLGRYGRIDLRWVPNGRVREVRVRCRSVGLRVSKKFFDAGAYVGTFWFRGGGGFTNVHLHRVAWRRSWYGVGNSCPRGIISEGYPGPGVILEAGKRGNIFSPIHMFVVKPEAGARVSYNLSDFRIEHGIKITRSAFVSGGAKTLTVSSDWATGQITPPAPFYGTASFERVKKAMGRLTGDLRVEFLDHTKLKLTGDRFEAVLHSGYYELLEP
jgi:hypothetical protein